MSRLKLPLGCYYQFCAYGSSCRIDCTTDIIPSIISVRTVTVDAGYVMTVTKRVPIMDTINGLKKRLIPEQ